MENTLEYALTEDKNDTLAKFRDEFLLPQKNGTDAIYMCGNSLGLQPKSVKDILEQELEDWHNLGVEGHVHAKRPWVRYEEFLTKPLAKLAGAKESEVVAMNGLTVNLQLMLVSFYRPTKEKHKIVMEKGAFPSDQYALESHIKYHGFDPKESLILIEAKAGALSVNNDDILQLIAEQGDEIALIMMGGVNYYSGQVFDMKSITEAGHKKGCVVGFDLAHAIGNIELHLHDWNVDFAVWCSYKYLNGGPGATGGCYVHEKHGNNPDIPRFAGWWGHEKSSRFTMPETFNPIKGAEGWQQSNVPVLSTAPLIASLQQFEDAGFEKLIVKSKKLTAYYEFLLNQIEDDSFTIITPKTEKERGCQLSIRMHKNGKAIHEKINNQGVIGDWREPDVIRIAPVPLYNTFEEAFRFVELFKHALV